MHGSSGRFTPSPRLDLPEATDPSHGPVRRSGWCGAMRRKHRWRYRGRLTRLASLALSLTAHPAAGLLPTLATLPVVTSAQGNPQSVTYRVTFEGKFTASALASGVSVPSGAHFTTLIGAVHNGSVTFWSDGGTASAGIESMAEIGGTSALESEINAAGSNALAVIEQSIASGGTATATVDITLTTDHPLVTLTSMVAPSPDWFVGVSGLSLRNTADNGWQPTLAVNLFPWDAGTEEGTEFSLTNAATSPQETITSIKGTGKFSNEPIATLTFDLQGVPEITTASPILVSENETAVATLTASDDDTTINELTWTIPSGTDGGADASSFTLSQAGVLAFTAAKDYETPDDADTDRTYEVTVQVSDGTDSDMAELLVTLLNVTELTEIAGPESATFPENSWSRAATFTASSEEDRGGIEWTLGGTDSDHFSIDTPPGALRFALDEVSPRIFSEPPDFEAPVDGDEANTYELTLSASAGTSVTAAHTLTVTVTDVDEEGELSLSSTLPALGAVLTADLSDPDGVTDGTAVWQWERSTGRNSWAVIDGAAAASYTPVAADTHTFLRVTATYADEHGTGKTASEVAPNLVTGPLLTGLTAQTDDSRATPARGLYPAFDALTLHYGIGCDSTDTLVLTVSAAADARVAVDGVQAGGAPVSVAVSEDSDVAVRVTEASGASTTYVVHCLPEVFFEIETHTFPGTDPFEDLILLNHANYLTAMDRNGVPRFRRHFPKLGSFASSLYRVGNTGAWQYGLPKNEPQSYTILDEDFEIVDDNVKVASPLTMTNRHDFQILEDGNYLLMSYEPATRDFSDIDPLTFEQLGREGEDFSRAVEYALDLDNHEAVFVRDHSLRGERSHVGHSTGNVNALDTGDWLVGWGRSRSATDLFPDNEMVTVVDPASGQEKLGIRFRELPSDVRARRISSSAAPAEALAPQPVPLTAEFPSSTYTSIFHTGAADAPRVVVAFSRPVADFDETSPSLSITGATVASVSPHRVAGEAANAYVVTLTPAGAGDITFGLVADQSCADGGICTADGAEVSEVPASQVIRADTTPPEVSRIEVSSNPGTDRTYAAGEEIRVTVTFSETVEVTGMPQLRLEVGGGQRTATYEGGSGTAALVFGHTVAGGESDTDGVSVEADSLSLNGGMIRDVAGNDAVLDHEAVTANASHKVDGVKPELAAPGGAVVDGTTLTLTYDEALDGSSTPVTGDFTVSGGDRVRTVAAVRVNGSGVELTLDVGAEQLEAGIEVSYTPGMNPLRDVPGNQAEGLSREPVTNETPDTTPPEVESLGITSNPASGQTYAAADEIEVTVRFSETVKVTGTPQLTLRVGSRNRTAGYESGSDTASLVFAYEVADGDEDTDGVSVQANPLRLNGGTIKDEAENAAELAHEALAADMGHQVDGVRPAFVSAAVDRASLTLTYGEALDGGSEPASGDFTVTVGGSGRTVSDASVSASVVTLTLNPEVEHGDTGIRVSYTPGANPIRDEVGNEALALSNRSVTNTTDAPNTSPEITTGGTLSVRENQALVRRLAAGDTDAGDEVTGWAVVGGVDQGQFSITPDTGDLSFQSEPDYEDPLDVASTDPVSTAGDNEYVVTVEVKSGTGARELTVEKTFTISVTDEREPPGVPEAPVISGETADSLTVSWSEPNNTGPSIDEYDVQYREKGRGSFTVLNHQEPGLSLPLSDLEPGTDYQVQVRAGNDEGTSGWSASGEGMTVTPLTVVMASGTESPVSGAFTVRFSFSEPVTGFSGNDVDSVRDPACTDDQNNPVFCEPGIGSLQTADDRVYTTTVTPETGSVAHSYTLTLTVEAGSVSSLVGNKPNEQPEDPLVVRVSPPGAPEPISTLSLAANGRNESVRLRWNRPSDNGGSAIIRYEYRYQAVGDAWSGWESVGGGSSGMTVGGLINGREYVFEVRGVNALGKGGVETVMATPAAGGGGGFGGGGGGGGGGGLLFPPEEPSGLAAMAGDGEVRVEWSPPENDGGSPIQRYEYRLKEGRGEFGEWTAIPASAADEVNASGFTVGDLLNGTVYAIELRAVNAAGDGQESESVQVTMPLDPTWWSNFRAEDLEGVELMLEAFILEGNSRDRQLRFGEGLRFEEDELDGEGEVTATLMGSYGYRYTSRSTGELSLEFDGGEACQLRLTFNGEGTGSYSYRCGGASRGQGSFELSELANRVPEITSTGLFEVEENTTTVGQLEGVDWDEEDEVRGYGIAGGADGGLFTVDQSTGDLSFRQAPDYENPGDVESEEPASAAADNEYIVVVEVTSGEGERERSRGQAVRVRVRDVEMEDAVEEEEDEKESLFVPVILSSAGRNQSFFTSELTLTNRGEQEVEIGYTYTSRDEPERRSGTASEVLSAGSQKIETDALDYLRGLGIPIPETGNQLGTLRVEVALGSEVEALVRTTTLVADGRAGLAYLGVAEEEGFREPVYLCGLRQNNQDRSNVAFQNMGAPGEGAITLKTTVYSGEAGDGTARELDDVTLEPGGFHQYSGLLGNVENGYVKVERVEGEAPFYAYGVINDQANSDGSFVFPVTAGSLEGKMGQTLPVIVETRDFTSELTVTNFSEEPRRLEFEFVSEQIKGDDKKVGFSMELEAGEQQIVSELVEALRREEMAKLGRSRGFYLGPLFVRAEEGNLSGIVIGARTSASDGRGGKYGVFYDAVPEGDGFSREAWVDGLQQNEENRSNLALVNTGEVDESESVFHLEIYNGETGTLEETVVTRPIPARGWHQIDGILLRAGPETRQGYIRIEKVSGENPFLAYGVVNDGGAPGERSGDGAYLPARE